MQQPKHLVQRYLDTLVSTPRGRAHILMQASDAEQNGEGEFFTALLERVDDRELQKMIRVHAADEVRHAGMFREAAERQGVPLPEVPQELQLLDRLDAALGGFMDRVIHDRVGVMEAYLLLQVIEERAVTQFAIFEPTFRRVDPKSADVFAAIARDEERHLKYCQAISRRYSPDEFTRARTLRRYRQLEARVFAETGRANMRHILGHDLLEVGWLEKLGWRALAGVAELTPAYEPTPFLGNDEERPGRRADSLGPTIAMA
jgi:rubrerythrin